MRNRAAAGCASCRGGGAPARVLLTRSRDDLLLLKTWSRRYREVRLQFEGLAPAERARLEVEVRRSFDSCGCVPARWAAVAAAGFAALAFAASPAAYASPAALIGLGAAVVITPLAVMLASIARARLRLWHQVDRIVRGPA